LNTKLKRHAGKYLITSDGEKKAEKHPISGKEDENRWAIIQVGACFSSDPGSGKGNTEKRRGRIRG